MSASVPEAAGSLLCFDATRRLPVCPVGLSTAPQPRGMLPPARPPRGAGGEKETPRGWGGGGNGDGKGSGSGLLKNTADGQSR